MIDIRATVESHSDIADDLLAIHGLSGADEVASFHGIGKATVVKVAKKGCFPRFCIGDVHAAITYVEAQAIEFMCAAYGKVAESCNSMTEYRVKMWRSETGKSGASSVKLCSIPPTTEAFTENVHICHLHCISQCMYVCISYTASTRHLGVALQHVAARKLGARSPV